jgi:AcrR family transcriptional regulator
VTNKTDQLTPRRRPSQERSRERVERILDATAALLGDDLPAGQITTAAIAESVTTLCPEPEPWDLRLGC